ncbi:MAG: hypothetical protein JWM51_2022 [Microbacteriaceae bacterium]|nr:hypothetical protein [Microbacteriaceae bacterium]
MAALGRSVPAEKYEEFTPALRRTYAESLACTGCGQPACFIRRARNGRAACFGARPHLDGRTRNGQWKRANQLLPRRVRATPAIPGKRTEPVVFPIGAWGWTRCYAALYATLSSGIQRRLSFPNSPRTTVAMRGSSSTTRTFTRGRLVAGRRRGSTPTVGQRRRGVVRLCGRAGRQCVSGRGTSARSRLR